MAPLQRFSIIVLFCLAACRHREKTLSFYYWKTSYHPDSLEKATLRENSVKTLYLRYFDVDRAPDDSTDRPIAPISFTEPPNGLRVVPVVYLKNRVFEKTDTAGVGALAQKVFRLVSQINREQQIRTDEIQFDCDWTDMTRERYFLFLRHYKALSAAEVTCTIRLHQIKYPGRTGIPPVQHGVLMYYNMGEINAGGENSIYERAVAHRYIPSLKTYPLSLDIALPLFTWGMQVREGHVIRLLNKMNFLHFQNDPNFERTDSNRYRARTACFSGGYYFMEDDLVKIEHVTGSGLEDIIADINQHTNHRIGNIIFYDLDEKNLILYEKDVFKKVLDHLN